MSTQTLFERLATQQAPTVKTVPFREVLAQAFKAMDNGINTANAIHKEIVKAVQGGVR